MIGRLIRLAGDAARRSLGDFLPGVGVAAAVTLLATVSLGFATLAAYSYLRSIQGELAAALIICAAYGAVAVAIWLVWSTTSRRRRLRLAHGAAPATTAAESAGAIDTILPLLTAAGGRQNQELFDMAVRLGREMTPVQLAMLALIGGFVVGRKRGK